LKTVQKTRVDLTKSSRRSRSFSAELGVYVGFSKIGKIRY